ncbi:MAG: terpene cyclase/mutase family protein [Thermoplasmata archaeon]|nr:terpene cyclase/mutase family protein [Thermoplasmata archaeon]
MADGHWITPGTSAEELYRPKFTATNWMAITLADLGMTRRDPRVRRTAELILARWSTKGGDLSGKAGEICVTGNAVRTLIRFGYLDDPRVQSSIDWILGAQKPDGGWHCFPSRTGTLDGWEGLAALAEIPESSRGGEVRRAIEKGAEFYLRRRLMDEGSPPHAPWFRIHYPNHYFYDLLVGLRVLSRLGYGADPRARRAFRWLKDKRHADGTWALDAAHPDFELPLAGPRDAEWPGDAPFVSPVMLEPLRAPSQWATVEALSVLARLELVDR